MIKSNRLTSSLLALSLGAVPAAAQTSSSPAFTAGNLVVSRSVYTGDASTVTVGQSLPPVCPSTAACGTTKATSNGAYPSNSNASNVFNNDKVDGSFGVTSPIYLDQITPAGALVSTLPIPSNMVTTSFSSKSELALNLSTDGSVLTFMGYLAPPNTIDVSNSNTPGVYDPTNPVGASYFRAVVQVGANGALQVTPVNAYSGNNGRAAILANGLYYMVGNNNNGSGTVPANIVSSTGVEVAVPGQAANTVPAQVGSFSITQLTDPATGKPYAADKAGKDNNFRGLTIFNNTLYVTKGSGGNGVDTVYQVGAAGSLPTLANAASTPITILPGFPTALATTADATYSFPFGIWFANATTLYVADEGDGVAADAATSTKAGLQKWVLTNGTWKMVYVLQNGLNLGLPYAVANYPASLNPATGGLRNLTGKVNGDGTVTLYAVTATLSTNGDQGADPNKLVSITDVVANADPALAARQQFATLRTAAAGEVLRGVSLAPVASPGAAPMANVPVISSAAYTSSMAIAPGELVFANGQNLTSGYPGEIIGPLPTTYNNTSVSITDAAGNTSAAALTFVSPWEIGFLVPSSVAPGSATITINNGSTSQTASNIMIAAVAPSLFTLNGSSLAAASAVRYPASGSPTVEPAYVLNSTGSYSPMAIDLGSGTDRTYLALFGTGIAGGGTAGTTATINGLSAPVVYAGPQGTAGGLDQVNVLIPSSLAGKGTVTVQLTAGGVAANPVQIAIQ